MEIIIEVAAKRREPRNAPSLFRLICFELCKRAREITTNVVSHFSSSDRSPRALTNPVQPEQPLSHAGSNMK
jgi:hypothetical protein